MAHPLLPRVETPHQHVYDLVVDEFHIKSTDVWRPQGTRDWLLILTLSGQGIVGNGKQEIISTPGTVTLYQPGTPQRYFVDPALEDWHTLWSHFYPKSHWALWLQWPEVAKGLRMIHLRDTRVLNNVSAAMRNAVRFGRQRLPGSSDFAANALELAILWINSVNQHRDLDERIRKATDLMAERLQTSVSLQSLAHDCGLSVSRLAHLFTEQMGVTPAKYLEAIRLQRAVQLLRSTSLSITEIAAETGYVNAFYFSNRFKKEFGKSPSDFRQSALSKKAK
ncbi:MAG: helix-turn-helix domain-containing protein [Chthoniobacterales bacterium]